MQRKQLLAGVLLAVMLCGALPTVSAANTASADDAVIGQVVSAVGILAGDDKGDLRLSSTVTRAELSKMLVAASTLRDKVGTASNASPFRDVPYTHWAAGYIKTAVSQGWLTGYLDGTFRPSNTVTLEEAATAALKLLGYTAADFSGSYPYGQLALYQSVGLDTRVTATQGTAMTRQNMMYLFYNLLSADTKDGKAYAETLGYTRNADGEIDYLGVLSDTMQGPVIAGDSIGIATAGKTVYRNGYVSSADALQKYDVLYYNATTIWAYANAVTGTYQGATPSADAPESVTVAGNTYKVGTGNAALSLSALGGLNVGDIVTLLLGRNGEVVSALTAGEYAKDLAGVVTATGTASYQNALGNSYTANTLTVTATDGVSYTVPTTRTGFSVGTLVSIGFGSSETDVSFLSGSSVSGEVSGGAIGKTKLSDGVRVLDVRGGQAVRVYASRLEGASLQTSDVRYAAFDAAGAVTDLILNDFTGDLYSYGVMLIPDEKKSDNQLSATYTYQIGDEKKTSSMSGTVLGASQGPSRFTTENGQLTAVKKLEALRAPDSISGLGVEKNGVSHRFADDCVAYLYENDAYTSVPLSEIVKNTAGYTVTAYYDKDDARGGRIRILTISKSTG